MSEGKIKIETDSSGKWISIDELPSIIEQIVTHCRAVIQTAGNNCAYTSYDIGVVKCTLRNCDQKIKEYFNV